MNVKIKNKIPGFISALIFAILCFYTSPVLGQVKKAKTHKTRKSIKRKTTLYGTASYYAQKFHGKRTASGEVFDHGNFTAACNALPLGTWVLVTNLKNSKTVYVRTNDRLSKNSTRLLDVTKAAARRLGFLNHGLTRVKIEVLAGRPD